MKKQILTSALLVASMSLSAQKVLVLRFMQIKEKKLFQKKSMGNLQNIWDHASMEDYGSVKTLIFLTRKVIALMC